MTEDTNAVSAWRLPNGKLTDDYETYRQSQIKQEVEARADEFMALYGDNLSKSSYGATRATARKVIAWLEHGIQPTIRKRAPKVTERPDNGLEDTDGYVGTDPVGEETVTNSQMGSVS